MTLYRYDTKLTEEDRKNNETLDDFLQKFDKAIELQKETQRRFDSNEKEVVRKLLKEEGK